ncbi:unnamed protein product [marine sediment metagenome]|uniref:Uncharacterized protein n=1 Tax=marine sediment metagenome TaxID=412755 RepID=X1P2Q8_9ZZZZ
MPPYINENDSEMKHEVWHLQSQPSCGNKESDQQESIWFSASFAV